MIVTDPVLLGFRLSTPVRLSWVSDAAQARWEPRFQAMRDALDVLDRASGLSLVRPSALHGARAEIVRRGLTFVKLTGSAGVHEPRLDARPLQALAIGTLAEVAAIRSAVEARCPVALSALTGLPACCLLAAWRLGSLALDLDLDPIWSCGRGEGVGLEVDLPSRPETNPLLRALGLALTPVPPCSFGCEAMATVGRARLERLRAEGHGAEADLLRGVLDWPMRWSELHGIAETATPTLRFIHGCAATGRKLVLRYRGTTMPEAAAQGLVFPYKQPVHRRLELA